MKVINVEHIVLSEANNQEDLNNKIVGHICQLVATERLRMGQKVQLNYNNAQVKGEVILRGKTAKDYYIYHFRILSGKHQENLKQ
ncbi:MAG: hypothetical protein IKO48_07290 [Elusimicrobia bacterium]|nr:hypothetical protein [Elusimicrobiota bacterium]